MNILDSLKRYTTVVADTGDFEAIAEHKPQGRCRHTPWPRSRSSLLPSTLAEAHNHEAGYPD
jgi:hypothetical protein